MHPAFFFYANPYRPSGVDAARALEKRLVEENYSVYSDPWLAAQGVGLAADAAHVPAGTRALVAFGGDGTLLRIMPDAFRQRLPMYGINTGSVGFLMEGSPDETEAAADMLIRQDYRVEACPVLEIRHGGETYLALNDLSLTRGEHPGVIEVTVLADGERVLTCHGDGAVIATPLGSTAYALSSGGPIVRPDVQCLTVTAIAARELLLRPVLLPLSSQVRMIAHGRDRRRLQLAVDGQTLLPVTEEAEIGVSVAPERALLIRPRAHSFFATLRRKQRIWNQDDEQE